MRQTREGDEADKREREMRQTREREIRLTREREIRLIDRERTRARKETRGWGLRGVQKAYLTPVITQVPTLTFSISNHFLFRSGCGIALGVRPSRLPRGTMRGIRCYGMWAHLGLTRIPRKGVSSVAFPPRTG